MDPQAKDSLINNIKSEFLFLIPWFIFLINLWLIKQELKKNNY